MRTSALRVSANDVTWPQAIARIIRLLERSTSPETRAAASEGGDLDLAVPSDGAEDVHPLHPPILSELGRRFGLSTFEHEVLALCVAARLNPRVGELCQGTAADPSLSGPTVGQALAVLDGAHWAAFAPDQPLRHWRMAEVDLALPPHICPLRIDERIFLHLLQVRTLDGRLAPLLRKVELESSSAGGEAGFEQTLVTAIQRAFSAREPLQLHLIHSDPIASLELIGRSASALNLRHLRLNANDIPLSSPERLTFHRLWTREVWLDPALLSVVDDSGGTSERREVLRNFLEALEVPAVLLTDTSPRIRSKSVLRLEVPKATRGERRSAWEQTLMSLGVENDAVIDRLASQFDLEPQAIASLGQSLEGHAGDVDERRIRHACRAAARPALESLAQRVEPQASWDQLILPDATLATLRQIESQVHHRGTVHERWGFAKRSARGLGITALFSGLSGTGKTFAAEVLGVALDLDLYRIDLSGIVSKYIGETEKNLRQVFDAAEGAGAILLFDEADALFGQRSDVKDSHDRYANLEISYLLQRMEAYQGLAILTTNLKSHLDPAFLRRLRFVVQFPFPDAAQRAELWRRAIPAQLPVEGLDFNKLSRPALTGGNIQTIAINAAFTAAEAGSAVTMTCLRQALMRELGKLERPVPEAELRDWI